MKDKPTKPKPTSKAKPKTTAKAGTSKPDKTPGGGGARKRRTTKPQLDSDPEKNSAIGEEPSITFQDAAFYLVDGTKTFYQNSPHAWDHLLRHDRIDPKEAATMMHMMGAIMRKGLPNVLTWANQSTSLSVAKWAQTLLADLCTSLEEFGLLHLPRSPLHYGAAFAARWADLHPIGRKRTKYAAITLFAFDLLHYSDQLLAEIWDTWKQGKDDEPPHKSYLRLLVEEQTRERAHELPGKLVTHWSDAEFTWHFYRRHPVTREIAWEKILWPLAQSTWPKYARDNEHFKSIGKWNLGQPLSDMKRTVDKKTDFGLKRHQDRLKSLVFDQLDSDMRYHGDGQRHDT